MRRIFDSLLLLLVFASPVIAQSKVTGIKTTQAINISVVSAQKIKATQQLRVVQPTAVFFTIYKGVVNGVPVPFIGALIKGTTYCLWTIAKDTTNTITIPGQPIAYISSDTAVAAITNVPGDTTIDPLVLQNTPQCP